MNNGHALVELTIRYGPFREKSKTLAVPISEDMTRELMAGVELSDRPFSLMLASPGMFGGHGNAVEIRRKAFRMRKAVAVEIAKAMVPVLIEAFGVNDEIDGYRVEDMSENERRWHQRAR